MQIQTNNYSIAEILSMLKRGELTVNRDYQRGAGIWPTGPKSYFIDTILSGFPFPKIYLYETYDRVSRELAKEIVDGQQRIGAIDDFVKGGFSISGSSRYYGSKFSDLDEDQLQRFMSYPVSCDVIRNASRGEILEMFRRMNAYTLPLNEAEKRHSSFHGEFKWYVTGLTDELGDFFASNTFTNRQIVRMADAELIAEITLGLMRGIISTSPSDLSRLYREFDGGFSAASVFHRAIVDQFRTIVQHLPLLTKSYMMKPYALYTLILGLVHLNEGVEPIEAQMTGMVRPEIVRWDEAQDRLLELARAHETKDGDGPSARYVWGCSGGTNRAPRRFARMQAVLSALGFKHVPEEMYGITFDLE